MFEWIIHVGRTPTALRSKGFGDIGKKHGAESDILEALLGIRIVVLSQRTLDLDRTFHFIEKGLQEN